MVTRNQRIRFWPETSSQCYLNQIRKRKIKQWSQWSMSNEGHAADANVASLEEIRTWANIPRIDEIKDLDIMQAFMQEWTQAASKMV